jgi:predicted DNA-binding WGR domain protein
MSDQPQQTYLTKIDSNANQYRYYSLRIDPDLFGRWSLFRQWGRLDYEGGSVRIDSFENEEEAMTRLAKITKQKLRRGYQQ